MKKLQALGIEPEATKWLLSNGKQEWSAVTIFDKRAVVIVYNSTHSESRLRSDLAHEFAHIILGHKPNRVTLSQNSEMAIRTFDVRQESEAEWLAGCLLAPRDGLFWCLQRGLSRSQMGEQLGISLQMVDYRLGVTGLTRQFAGHFSETNAKKSAAR